MSGGPITINQSLEEWLMGLGKTGNDLVGQTYGGQPGVMNGINMGGVPGATSGINPFQSFFPQPEQNTVTMPHSSNAITPTQLQQLYPTPPGATGATSRATSMGGNTPPPFNLQGNPTTAPQTTLPIGQAPDSGLNTPAMTNLLQQWSAPSQNNPIGPVQTPNATGGGLPFQATQLGQASLHPGIPGYTPPGPFSSNGQQQYPTTPTGNGTGPTSGGSGGNGGNGGGYDNTPLGQAKYKLDNTLGKGWFDNFSAQNGMDPVSFYAQAFPHLNVPGKEQELYNVAMNAAVNDAKFQAQAIPEWQRLHGNAPIPEDQWKIWWHMAQNTGPIYGQEGVNPYGIQ